MPNWCRNNLSLSHKDADRITEAVAAFEQGRFLEHFVPLPNGEWDYEFCVNSWGTKWDVGSQSDPVSLDNDHTVHFCFDSAWAPPIAAYEQMCAQGFELEATYHEPGMCFVGSVQGDAESFVDDYREYAGETSDTVRAVIGNDLDDEFAISEQMAYEEYDQQELDIEEYELPPHTD